MPPPRKQLREKCLILPRSIPHRLVAVGGAAFALLTFFQPAAGEDLPALDKGAEKTAKPLPLQIVDPDLVPSVREARPGKVEIRGLVSIEEEKARSMITFQLRNLEETGVTMARADDAAFFLQTGIRNLGYDKARVDWEIKPNNSVVLAVDEGGLLHFGELTVNGNEHLSDEAVRELLTKVTRERLGYRTDAPKIPYVANDVAEGGNGVRHFYTLLGFTDAEVQLVSSERRTDTDIVDIVIDVSEGTVRRVGEITFPDPIEPTLEEVYSTIRTEFTGKPFTEAVMANLEDQIVTVAQEAGYYDADVIVDPSEARSAPPGENGEEQMFVDLDVKADWGQRYLLNEVKVSGIEKIRESVIDRRFHHLLGKPYSPTATSKAMEKLLETGAFEGLTFEPSPLPDGTISLSVVADEAKRKRLGVYGGFGTYEGAILGLDYRNSNYLGRLRAFEALVEFNSRGLRGDIEYTNPWLFNTDWRLTLGASSLTEQHEGYTIWDTGLRLGVMREFGEDQKHRVILFAKPEYGEVTDFEIEERFLGPTEYFTSQAGLIYSFGRRNGRLSSTRGFSADLVLTAASSAIGSEVEFGRAALRVVYLQPIGKTTLRLGARAGIIKPFDDEDLPIDLRFFSGGPRSVRSFRERDLGQHDINGYPTGGEFSTAFNVEYDIPIAGPLSIAPFFDAGNLLPDAEDASFDAMHYAGGIGLVLNSPIGPLRIDYGHNLNRGKNEPSGSWHVGFGFAF